MKIFNLLNLKIDNIQRYTQSKIFLFLFFLLFLFFIFSFINTMLPIYLVCIFVILINLNKLELNKKNNWLFIINNIYKYIYNKF